MKLFERQLIIQPTAWFLTFLFLGGPGLHPQEDHSQRNQLEQTFRWAVMDYQKEKYRDVISNLELLLTYFDEEPTGEGQEGGSLKGKIFLLLGAAYENSRQSEKAKEFYRSAHTLLGPNDPGIEGIDFEDLEEYRRIFKGTAAPGTGKKGIIERPLLKPKKKRFPTLLAATGAALIGGITAYLLLKKKKSEKISVDPNYDTATLKIEWVNVPAGEFQMGDNFNEGGEDEQPVHVVYLDGFYMSKYEITFSQFDKFCEETGRTKPGAEGWGRENRPVMNISWSNAGVFCEWLSQKTLKKIKLPTEAQWEKAARGPDQRRYPWGNTPPDCATANYGCDMKTHPVGSHEAGVSPYGIHDLAGNVSEWCRDQYENDYYSRCPYRNPYNQPPYLPDTRFKLVLRGGSWDNAPAKLFPRSSDRGYGNAYQTGGLITHQETISPDIGFRIVMEQ